MKTLFVARWASIILPVSLVTMITGFALDISVISTVGLLGTCAIAGLFMVTGLVLLAGHAISSIRELLLKLI